MSIETRTDAVRMLENVKEELHALARKTQSEIVSVARDFAGLAGDADTILNLAGAIVGCVEKEGVSAILPKVQTLGATAQRFIGDRLQATEGIVEMVTAEVKLLQKVSRATAGQAAIAFETKTLSLLTNIEVARLDAVGTGFQYLSSQLAEVSKSLSVGTLELDLQTDAHRQGIKETKGVLETELPRLREELARIEIELGNALADVDSTLTQLFQVPAQFRKCVQDVREQIAGVVRAIQANDITRQQIEHVQEAFELISAKICRARNSQSEPVQELALAHAGLTIQIYQLKTIKETVASWASQIRTCIGGILRVNASDVVGIGPLVLEQEHALSSRLAGVERLERQSHAQSERIRSTSGGCTHLVQLVTKHLQRSKSINNRLQLLTFNSIIEASRLGRQAAAILAIADCIKGISMGWGKITDQSGQAVQEVQNLMKQANGLIAAFSEARVETLREAQVQTTVGLESLRTAAAFTARQAQEMGAATQRMQAKSTDVGNCVDLLDACYGPIDAILTELEAVKRQLERDYPEVEASYDTAEIERQFSAAYTTEMERDVLHAALRGTGLPVAQQTLAGNDVELF